MKLTVSRASVNPLDSAALPLDTLRDPSIPLVARFLRFAIWDLAQLQSRNPTAGRLAAYLGRSERTVRRTLASLRGHAPEGGPTRWRGTGAISDPDKNGRLPPNDVNGLKTEQHVGVEPETALTPDGHHRRLAAQLELDLTSEVRAFEAEVTRRGRRPLKPAACFHWWLRGAPGRNARQRREASAWRGARVLMARRDGPAVAVSVEALRMSRPVDRNPENFRPPEKFSVRRSKSEKLLSGRKLLRPEIEIRETLLSYKSSPSGDRKSENSSGSENFVVRRSKSENLLSDRKLLRPEIRNPENSSGVGKVLPPRSGAARYGAIVERIPYFGATSGSDPNSEGNST